MATLLIHGQYWDASLCQCHD
ncbi:MAG TPA: hypothetical protein DEV38_00600 [Psychrobacter sp.]|nr:hypothetical protein [Psychrobacter sp.]